MEGQGRSRKVMDGIFPTLDWHFRSEKLLVVGWWWPVGLYCQPQSQSLSSGLLICDMGFGTGLGLDNSNCCSHITIICFERKHRRKYCMCTTSPYLSAAFPVQYLLHFKWYEDDKKTRFLANKSPSHFSLRTNSNDGRVACLRPSCL